MAENAILNLDFVNTLFCKKTIFLIFIAEFIESVLSILSHSESTVGPNLVEREEKFSKLRFLDS